MKTARLFIALPLPKKIKQSLGKIQTDLKKAGLKAKWVKPKDTHLTLVFLGSTNPNQIEPIGQIIENASRQIKPIKLHFLEISGFPQPYKARVIYVGLGGELGKLHALALKVSKVLKKEKIHFDQKFFSAHLTLGRFKTPQNLSGIMKKVKVKRTEFILDEVSLIKSKLTSTGPIYIPIKTFTLKKHPRGVRSTSLG